jgi:anti-sigma regulatory factor (Ser/Thr protein kinase)
LHRTIIIGQDPEPVRSLRTLLTTFLRDRSLPDKEVRALVLAFSEALDNAVEHGSNGRSTIAVRLRFSPRFLLISLRDEGSDRVPLGASCEPDEDSERGRGFQIMNQVMDYVRVKVYPNGGTRVSMLRRFDPLP